MLRLFIGLILLGGSSTLAASFPLSEVTPGLTGYGITAGPGNVLERFDVEVLGVQQDVGLGFPLVLVRTSGELIEASGGVAAGMSGSPVYLQNEGEEALLGAVGYVFPNSDHQLALVTPIAAMRGEEVSGYTPSGAAHFAIAGTGGAGAHAAAFIRFERTRQRIVSRPVRALSRDTYACTAWQRKRFRRGGV